MPALTDEDRDILRKAAEEILRRGLYTGGAVRSYQQEDREDYQVCTLGAVALMVYGDPEEWVLADNEDSEALYRIVRALDDALPAIYEEAGGSPMWRVVAFNDGHRGLPKATAEEVAELFLNVADNY